MTKFPVLLGVLLVLGVSACQGAAPPSPVENDLVATQVAIALTQTALAVWPTARPTPVPQALTPTSAAPTPWPPASPTFAPPTPAPPTPPPTLPPPAVTPPSDGPCTDALLAPSPGPAPDPNDIATFVGYRFPGGLEQHFSVLAAGPRMSTLLNSTQLGPGTWGDGFALSVYLRSDLGSRQIFLERMVCRPATGQPYWEVTDVLELPAETVSDETIFLAALSIWFPPALAEGIHTEAEFAGEGWATLHCAGLPEPTPQPIALLTIAPEDLPPTIGADTTLPALAAALWVIDPALQQFRRLVVPHGGLPCTLAFHW